MLIHCIINFISLNRGGSYIDSLKLLKTKNATINTKNNNDKCFQYAITVALSHEQIKKDPQKNSNSLLNNLLTNTIGKR